MGFTSLNPCCAGTMRSILHCMVNRCRDTLPHIQVFIGLGSGQISLTTLSPSHCPLCGHGDPGVLLVLTLPTTTQFSLSSASSDHGDHGTRVPSSLWPGNLKGFLNHAIHVPCSSMINEAHHVHCFNSTVLYCPEHGHAAVDRSHEQPLR
jgi:hypothetical protein